MKILIALLCVCCISSSVFCEDWKPAPFRLATQWAAKVSPDNALPDYPRPQMVREKWLNLNGLWQYRLATDAQDLANLPDGHDLSGNILVPFPLESALSGVMQRSERVLYRRTFDVPKEWAGQRVLLHFGAVNWESTVLVNGKKVTEHQGGYDPFSADITDALKEGSQELVVTAYNPANKGEQPRGKQVNNPGGIFYLPSTGIWQTVWLEPVPQTYIRDIVITPDVNKGQLQVLIEAAGDTTGVTCLGTTEGSGSGSAPDGQTFKLVILTTKLDLWSPNSPRLYDLQIVLKKGEKNIDAVKTYFAMRKIEVAKVDGVNRILLNGKFVFQMGELDQGFWPDGLYTAPTDAALKYDIEIAKQLGFNMIRKHVKVEPQRWYYWTDVLGVLVWQDMPSGNDKPSPAGQKQHELEFQRMIDNLRNHPSIVLWVVFNEGWGQYDTERITEWVKKYDPTRLTDNASGWTDKKCGDVVDMHNYPGPGVPPLEDNRAAVLGEFGGIGFAVKDHQWVKSDKNWGYGKLQETTEGVTRRYEQLLRKTWDLAKNKGLNAAVYTQITDVETESNGLLSYDRAIIKPDLQRTAAANKGEFPVYTIKELVPSSQHEAQTWRYTTTKPADDWFKPDFDDSKWSEGPAGFGTKGTPGAVVGTEWKTADIWIRRQFELKDETFDDAALWVFHDEDIKVYINGVLGGEAPGYITEYEELDLNPEGKKALKKGINVLAVTCHQTQGGQDIDVGLIRRAKGN